MDLLIDKEGLTDREITNAILGVNEPQQAVNQVCRLLTSKGIIRRIIRRDGLIGNYIIAKETVQKSSPLNQTKQVEIRPSIFKEDNLKQILKDFLHADGWETQIAWGERLVLILMLIEGLSDGSLK